MNIEIITKDTELTIYDFSGTAFNKDYAGTAFKLAGKCGIIASYESLWFNEHLCINI